MTSDLSNKVVLVTGASTGIGAAAALAFARAGSKVVVHYNASRDAAESVVARAREAGARADAVHGDVTAAGEVRRIVAQAMALHGRIDVLVNNAGGMVGRIRIEDYTEDYLQQVLALNVTQVALFMKEVVPGVREERERPAVECWEGIPRNQVAERVWKGPTNFRFQVSDSCSVVDP